MASEAGIAAVICNGTEDGTLAAAAAGEVAGTSFRPSEDQAAELQALAEVREAAGRHAVRRRWGGREAPRGGVSLLPVGIVDTVGAYNAGDAVEVVAHGERSLIGKGISNYSSAEMGQVLGMKTSTFGKCSRTPPTRSSTETASCCSEGRAPSRNTQARLPPSVSGGGPGPPSYP